MRATTRFLALVLVVLVHAGCASTDARVAPGFEAQAAVPARVIGRTVLLLPADVVCAQVTAGGVAEPRADWTEAARANVEAALERAFAARGADLITYDRSTITPARAQAHDRVLKLNEAVGMSIYFMQDYLPTKRAVFEWSVGEGARSLGEDFDADYALFVFLRDSHASAGLVGMNVLKGVLALGGIPVGMTTGVHFGFAQLVDLRTGQVFWFNKMTDMGPQADLRTGPDAERSVGRLLQGCPL